ncbi:hypothetical protein YC2023_019471 [Brassica napus]
MASKAISMFLLSLVLLYASLANIPTAKTAKAQSFMFDPCKISEECDAANCASGEALCIREQCHCISSSNHLAKLNKLSDLKPCKDCVLFEMEDLASMRIDI